MKHKTKDKLIISNVINLIAQEIPLKLFDKIILYSFIYFIFNYLTILHIYNFKMSVSTSRNGILMIRKINISALNIIILQEKF